MKPCSNRRKSIALLALEELDEREAEGLRSHLQACEGCRQYLEEIYAVTGKMAAVQNTSEIEASDAFHRNVVARLREQESAGRNIARMIGQFLNWRVALPATAVCAVLIIGICAQRRGSKLTPKPIVTAPTQIVAVPGANADVPPTIGNYQMAADQSLQKFDELLDREAKQAPPTVPGYRASTLTLGDMAE